MQSKNEFEITKPSLEHEEDNHSKDKDHKSKLPSQTNINLITHPYEGETYEDLDQRELEVLHCENDTIPRGLAPLEELFDFNDVAKKPKMESTEVDIEEYTIGSIEEPKIIKLSKTLPPHIKQKYVELFK